MLFTTDTVPRELEESGAFFLQFPQKPGVLELDLVLETIAEILDQANVSFHFLFFSMSPLFSQVSTSPSSPLSSDSKLESLISFLAVFCQLYTSTYALSSPSLSVVAVSLKKK